MASKTSMTINDFKKFSASYFSKNRGLYFFLRRIKRNSVSDFVKFDVFCSLGAFSAEEIDFETCKILSCEFFNRENNLRLGTWSYQDIFHTIVSLCATKISR